jgi:citrate lyase subunit beta/citryl-CoA lyase
MSGARSWLFVPGDSDRKMGSAFASDAQALVFDWEDAVAPQAKSAARLATAAALRGHGGAVQRHWIRLNALASPWFDDDLAALPATGIAGVMLPKACGPADVERLGQRLAVVEQRDGIAQGSLAIVAIVTETAESVLALTDFRRPLPRLAAMLWGGEDLAADLGVGDNRDAGGRYRAPFALARNLTLMAASATRSIAIDAVQVDFRNASLLEFECAEARLDGFTAKAAIHPGQIAVINESFGPTAAERAWAERVVLALQDGGLAIVDGKMVDAPHLRAARRILEG